MKKCFKKGTIKVRKLILKERKGVYWTKNCIFKRFVQKTSTIPSVVKDQNNFWALNMKNNK